MNDIYKSIVEFCGCGMLNQATVAKFFGWSRPSAKKFLSDVPTVTINGRKYYTATAIAKKLEENHD